MKIFKIKVLDQKLLKGSHKFQLKQKSLIYILKLEVIRFRERWQTLFKRGMIIEG